MGVEMRKLKLILLLAVAKRKFVEIEIVTSS